MSFEGYYEYLCPNKHHWSCDVRDEGGPYCPVCNENPALYRLVDETNGVVEDDPSTMASPLLEVGFQDDWKVDHYQNRYAVKIKCYEPIHPNDWKVY